MNAPALPFRQVHLDFHTSEHIPEVGADFDAARYVAVLQAAGVESVVTFAKCHHGWSYYDTTVGERHPSLRFDLLRQQHDACKAAGIRVPIYLSVGWDERAARLHQDWRQVQPDGSFFCLLGRNLDAAWSYLCLNSPYLDALCEQIAEVLRSFPQADGLWLDIIRQEQCCCVHCQAGMSRAGLDWTREADRVKFRERTLREYYRRTTATIRAVRRDVSVFHNTATVPRGDRGVFEHFSHLEIEAVPTGGWGYDHLPLSARYAETLGLDRMAVTVRFNLVWGELGGYKHPNALRAEAMTMLALGCKVCIGDQLDPRGELDASAYRMIGQVFAEVDAKRAWCVDSSNVAEIALLSSAATRAPGSTRREERHCEEDEGALRMLQEQHFLFDVIDQHADFAHYRLIVLPDRVRLDEALAAKLEAYRRAGGRLLLTGESGLSLDGTRFAIDVGATLQGASPFDPTFIAPVVDVRPDFIEGPFIAMGPSLRIVPSGAVSLGEVHEPYFNRSPLHFNGHINAPARPEPSGFACGVIGDGTAYLAHPVFSLYRRLGASAVRDYVTRVLRRLLRGSPMLVTDAPKGMLVTLRRQHTPDRYLLHLVYAPRQLRGQTILGPLEVIEDLPSVGPVSLTLRLPGPIRNARLQPDGTPVRITSTGDAVQVVIRHVQGHALVELAP